MKSVAVLGLGVFALTTISSLARGSYFEAEVEGAVHARPFGEVAFGIVGDRSSGMAAFTITLDAEGSSGAILFTSLEGEMPAPGRYEVSDGTVAGGSGFRASYIGGSAEHPSGLFRAQRGILEITASTAEHISGHFSFTAGGFLATHPSDERSEVIVNGAFTSTHALPLPRPDQP
jgi:hypothetical protein